MKRFLFSMIGLVALLVCAGTDAFACSCVQPFPNPPLRIQVINARNEARAVFSGKVVEITEDPQNYSLIVKFKPERVWKSSLPAEVSVVTGRGGGDCGYGFQLGQRYLVYAYGPDENRLGTGICQRTANLAGGLKDLRILGKGKIARKRGR